MESAFVLALWVLAVCGAFVLGALVELLVWMWLTRNVAASKVETLYFVEGQL